MPRIILEWDDDDNLISRGESPLVMGDPLHGIAGEEMKNPSLRSRWLTISNGRFADKDGKSWLMTSAIVRVVHVVSPDAPAHGEPRT